MSEIVVSKISGLSNVVVGNSTVNVAFTSTGMTASNSSSNTVISPTGISINGENISSAPSFRNKIINGKFDFWQRATSNNSVANNQYLADRWVTLRANTTANVSRQSFTLGQTDVPNEPTYFYRTTTTSNTNSDAHCVAVQRIESVKTLAGKNAVLTFWAKADNTKNIAIEMLQCFGTGGSPSANVTGISITTCALTTSWQKFTVPISVPSISGKTLGSNINDYLAVNFWFDAGSTFNARTNTLGQQSGVFDIAQVQLEEGSVATPFEQRPMAIEMTLCQRYYETGTNETIWGGDVTSGGSYYLGVPFAVCKRATATVSASRVAESGFSAVNPTVSAQIDRFSCRRTANATTAGGYYLLIWTADAEL